MQSDDSRNRGREMALQQEEQELLKKYDVPTLRHIPPDVLWRENEELWLRCWRDQTAPQAAWEAGAEAMAGQFPRHGGPVFAPTETVSEQMKALMRRYE